MNAAVFQTNGGLTLRFSLIARAILSANPCQVADTAPPGNDLDVGNLADDLEVHAVS
jgi:hypothetical protein